MVSRILLIHKTSQSLSKQIVLTRVSLFWERFWSASWLPASILGIVVAIALTDSLHLLPGWIHLGFLLLVSGSFLVATFRGFINFQAPTKAEAKQRLESVSHIEHRPVTSWEDSRTENHGRLQTILWNLHRNRALENLRELQVPLPRPRVASRDRYSLRAVATMLLVVGVVGAWGEIPERLERAMVPILTEHNNLVSVKVWITPPDYTQLKPIYLEASSSGSAVKTNDHVAALGDPATTIPHGSMVLAVVTGTNRVTRLEVGKAIIPLINQGGDSHSVEAKLPLGDTLRISQGSRTLAEWKMTPVSDQPPLVDFLEKPKETGRWRLKIDYRAKDDYGLDSVVALLTRTENQRTLLADEVITFPLSMPPLGPKNINHSSFHDLTAHPWAGLHVQIQLTALDLADQTGQSQSKSIILPERIFSHPIARQLVSYRKLLVENPGSRLTIVERLTDILEKPAEFGNDVKIFLALATAKARLIYATGEEASISVLGLLWQTALRLEDGKLFVAEQALEEAEHALAEALDQKAPTSKVNQLIDQLKLAMQKYYKVLAERMPGDGFSEPVGDWRTKLLMPQDISQMMEKLRELSQVGANEAAQHVFSELQNMLESLRSAAQKNNLHPDIKTTQHLLQELKDLIRRQSQMLDQSFQEARKQELQQRQRAVHNADNDKRQDATERQLELRKQLGDLMTRIAEIANSVPESMGKAEQAMRDAENALSAGGWLTSSEAQARAVHNLKKSLTSASTQMMKALAERGLQVPIPIPLAPKSGQFDPLGRRLEPVDDQTVQIPTRPDIQRSRQILDEIRRRASERTRPQREQDYLRRLMKQF